MSRNSQPILIVEDGEEDREAARRAFKKAGLGNPVFECESAYDALDFLFHRGRYSAPDASPRPGIIILDLNLPGMDGRQFLHAIKNDPKLRMIPVVILTTSSNSRDVEKCYLSGANGYIQKPVDFDKFLHLMKCLVEFWFEIAILPEGEPFLRAEHGTLDHSDR